DNDVFVVADMNNAFTNLIGATAGNIVGTDPALLFTAADADVAINLPEVLSDAMLGKPGFISATPLLIANDQAGQKRFFDVAITPLGDDISKPVCLLLTFTEVTEAIALRQRAELAEGSLEESALLMKQVQEMANFGNWRWDIAENKVTWSEALYYIYGLDKATFKATFEGYQELLHPEDRQRVLEGIMNTLHTKRDIVFEERIIRPGGELRHLRSWGRVQCDENGLPVRMIGACLDITESKLAEALLNGERQKHIENIEQQHRQLQELAWMQSHVIRAPVARILGLAEVMKFGEEGGITQEDLLHHLFESVRELDVIIRDISSKMDHEKLGG
ncbi:MAG TPA: PAS domain-containing protein, partial [Mucilaginibacter sp.]